MNMTADHPNHSHSMFLRSLCNQQVVSFQNPTVNREQVVFPVSSDQLPMVGVPVRINGGASPKVASVVLAEPTHGLKLKLPVSADWSQQEVKILKDGLAKYAGEDPLAKYVKIALDMPNKTVRDIALRCQWMARKEKIRRQKFEEGYLRKKTRDHSIARATRYPLHHIQRSTTEDFHANNPMQELLAETNKLLGLITENIQACQVERNHNLFKWVRSNISIALSSMDQMPGLASRMLPLPVSMDDGLYNRICGTTFVPPESRGNRSRTTMGKQLYTY